MEHGFLDLWRIYSSMEKEEGEEETEIIWMDLIKGSC